MTQSFKEALVSFEKKQQNMSLQQGEMIEAIRILKKDFGNRIEPIHKHINTPGVTSSGGGLNIQDAAIIKAGIKEAVTNAMKESRNWDVASLR